MENVAFEKILADASEQYHAERRRKILPSMHQPAVEQLQRTILLGAVSFAMRKHGVSEKEWYVVRRQLLVTLGRAGGKTRQQLRLPFFDRPQQTPPPSES